MFTTYYGVGHTYRPTDGLNGDLISLAFLFKGSRVKKGNKRYRRNEIQGYRRGEEKKREGKEKARRKERKKLTEKQILWMQL